MDRARRQFLSTTAAVVPLTAVPADLFAREAIPMTGKADTALAPFDELMRSFVEKYQVPGAALAVGRHGRLVYARGFGYADVEARVPVAPDARFRIASVSKPLTAVAVLQLVDRGKLRLDEPALDQVPGKPFLAVGATLDPRVKRITLRQLLHHTGGWDRDKSGDPIGVPQQIAKALGIGLPVGPEAVVRYTLGRPLDFDPGARHAYSNVGYLLLGQAIATAAGRPYEAVVADDVLRPLGVHRMRLGRALAENRLPGEVKYYDRKNRKIPCVYPPRVDHPVPVQYGGSNLEAYEAHGGWVASAIDLVRFGAGFDRQRPRPLLSAAALAALVHRPTGRAGHDESGKPLPAYYGGGWMVRPVAKAGAANLWHTGLIVGTSALLVRRWDGLTWAVLFNTDRSPDGAVLSGLIDPLVHQAADRVRAWPGA